MISNLFTKAKSNHLVKNSFVFFVGSLVASAFSYLFHMCMGRMLSVAEYGELQSLISIYMIIFLPSTALTLVVTRFSSHNYRLEEFYKVKFFFKKITKSFILASCLVSLSLIVFCKQIASFLQLSSPLEVVVFSLVFLFLFLLAVNKGVLQGFHFFKDLSWVVVLETSSKFIFGVLLVWFGWKIYGAIWAIVIGFAVSYLYSFLPLRRIFNKNRRDNSSTEESSCASFVRRSSAGGRRDCGGAEKNADATKVSDAQRGAGHLRLDDELKDLTKYAMPVVFSLLGVASLLSFDVILAKHYFTPELAGAYGGLAIIGRVIYFAAAPLSGVLFSISSRQHKDGENYQNSFLLSFVLTLAVGACAIFGYFLFPRLIIQTILGGKYIGVAGYLGWYAVAITMLSLVNLLVNFLLSIRMTKCVYFVLFGVLLQIVGIAVWHKNIWQFIFISNAVLFLTLVFLFLYFFSYEKHTWRSCFNR
ncbi:MAG: oligosaccharide flippase family protein [bacterium]